jgi:ACS family D-galactonate transporter-like MFS transporter
MAGDAKQAAEQPTNVRGRIFALACGTSWLLYLHRYAFSLIKPQLAEEWHLGSDQLGLLDSGFSLCYTVCQVPLGIAADVVGVHLVLTGMIVAWSIGLGMHAWAATTAQLWYARGLLGAGQSAVFAALNRISRQWFAPAVRTTQQGFVDGDLSHRGARAGVCRAVLRDVSQHAARTSAGQ